MLKMVFQTTPSMIIERGASTRLAKLAALLARSGESLKQQRLLGNNPRELCLEDVRSIYGEIL